MKNALLKLKPYLSHPIAWISLAILSCILSLGSFLSAKNNLDILEERCHYLQDKKKSAQIKKSSEDALTKQLKLAHPDFVETELESLPFLAKEKKKIEILLHSDPHNESLTNRLHFLEKDQNALQFKQEDYSRHQGYQEVMLNQKHPIEMNGEDLKMLLARIENLSIGQALPGEHSPYLIIKNFDLLKKRLTSNEETFILNLKLVKRELAHE